MPIYEYACTNCGERFELLRKFSDKDDNIKCPKCNKLGVKRTLSTFATVSSGSTCAPSMSGHST